MPRKCRTKVKTSDKDSKKVNWPLVAGGVVTAGALALAPVDGGASALASWSAFSTAFGAGAVTSAEVAAAGAAGAAATDVVAGLMGEKRASARTDIEVEDDDE